VSRGPAFYVVDCRVGEAHRWEGGWFQFYAGPNRRKAKRMMAQSKLSYADWARFSVRLRKWVRPQGAGIHGWMSERRP